ncbi:MAG: winged helix-turn-helix transcriptional regulator [Microlunatus sp.]|nr:winged helix-turn-helix transcriptional regulator [Microlunatus sp.]
MTSDRSGIVDERAAAMADLEREISIFFRRARSLSARIAGQIHPDLDAPGYALLATIVDLDPDDQGVRAVDVAHRTKLHKSTLSRSIADLERLGLVARVRDPNDARARLVTLTERGRTAVERSRLGRSDLMLHRLAEWDTADLIQLASLLQRFSTALTVDDHA